MVDDRERWALVLGASSGMGEAAAIALAEDGYRICGIHLDFRAGLAHVEEIRSRIDAAGSEALFINMNAADDAKRASAIETLARRFEERRADGAHPYLRVVLHSLAFGSLYPYLTEDPKDGADRKRLEMTLDVMANSLVYWVQDLWRAGMLERGSRIWGLTSEGSTRVVPTYGMVSAAKAALESHVRQLAMEFSRLGTGITANCLRPGVTMTPALMRIPEHDEIIAAARRRNPSGRMTTVEDVARALVALSGEGTGWISGEIIGVDGAEFVTGS